MLKAIAKLFQPLPTMDQTTAWAMHNQHRCSPDQIISAAIVESYIKHPEDWTFSGMSFFISAKKCWQGSEISQMSNSVKSITVKRRAYITRSEFFPDHCYFKATTVTTETETITLSKEAEIMFLSGIKRVKMRLDAVQATANKALNEMQANERAWNIAENLLGMKRNEFGALVPMKTVEG